MQDEREHLQVVSIGVLHLFPLLDFGLSRRYQCLPVWGVMRGVGQTLASGQCLLGFREFLARLAYASANDPRIALGADMDDMEEIGHAETLQPFFGKLNQGLGPAQIGGNSSRWPQKS